MDQGRQGRGQSLSLYEPTKTDKQQIYCTTDTQARAKKLSFYRWTAHDTYNKNSVKIQYSVF